MDVTEEIKYFDKLLERYSAASISAIDLIEGNGNRLIVITLLRLEAKHKIKFLKDEIEILDYDTTGLTKSEVYVLLNIIQGKVRIKSFDNIYKIAYKECAKNNFMKSKKTKYMDIGNIILVFVLVAILITFFLSFYEVMVGNIDILGYFKSPIVKWIFRIILIAMLVVYLLAIFSSSVDYERTKIGNDLNQKIDVFKSYINNNKKDFEFWDNYEIYSIMFGIDNTKKYKEISKYITTKEAEIIEEKR